jgi:hypothetical protein
MRLMPICTWLVVLPAVVHAEDAPKKAPEIRSYKVGGTPIAIPSPTKDMNEVGDDRKLMEVFVPATNRLVAGFLRANDLARLKKGEKGIYSAYAMVQAVRNTENRDTSASDFKDITAVLNKRFLEGLDATVKKSEEEVNRRLKSLDADSDTVSLGKCVNLGRFFSKQDAYAFGAVVPVSGAGRTAKMGAATCILRVKNRLLLVYLYAEYKGKDTVKWLQKTAEEWTDAILKANKEKK